MKSFIVVLCLLTSVCFANGNPPIQISDGENGNTLLLTVRSYSYVVKERELGVQLQLEKGDAEKLSVISGRYVGKHLSLAIGNSQVSSPRLRDALKGTTVWLTFQDHKSLEAVEKALAGNHNR